MKNPINVYKSVKQPKVFSLTTITEWFNLIKSSDYSSSIEEARNGNLSIKDLKENKLPCVTYNFLYNDYKKDDNIIGSTGYLFIDIDNTDFDINSIDKSKVTGYYRSTGDKGYHIIVSVDNLTIDNFKEAYLSICNELGISKFIDHNAIKKTQYAVLSYDTNAWLNDNPFVFDVKCTQGVTKYSNENVPNQYINNKSNNDIKCTQGVYKEEEKNTYSDTLGTKLRYDNLDEIDTGDELYVTNWDEGYEVIKAFLPTKKLTDNRYNTLLAYANQIAVLNPTITADWLSNVLCRVQESITAEPIPINRIKTIVNTIMKYKEEGRLTGKPFKKKRRIVFNPLAKLTKEEKLTYVGEAIKTYHKDKGIQRIDDILNNWDKNKYGKVSIRNIAKHHPIDKKTAAKYYSLFTDKIKAINNVKNKKMKHYTTPEHITNFSFKTHYSFDLDTTLFYEVYSEANTAVSNQHKESTMASVDTNTKSQPLACNNLIQSVKNSTRIMEIINTLPELSQIVFWESIDESMTIDDVNEFANYILKRQVA